MMLEEHHGYLADSRRIELYSVAVAEAIRGGERVLDLGCGSGILGLLCLKAGAGHVIFVEDTAMIEVAVQTMANAGYSGRCTFVRGRSQRLSLETPADLVICDHVGYFGFDYGLLDIVHDARARLVRPGGRSIPQQLSVDLAAIESEACRTHARRWAGAAIPSEYHWVAAREINRKYPATIAPGDVLAPPQRLATMTLGDPPASFLSWQARFEMARDGLLDGIAGWFECTLTPSVTMTNSPLATDRIDRNQAFFPIGEPLPVQRGDIVECTMSVRPEDHLFSWSVSLPARAKSYRHSNWMALALNSDEIGRANPLRVPRTKREALARARILNYCDGTRNAEQIELAAKRELAGLYDNPAELARFIASVLRRDTDA